jgi:PAS domain S-box-containing protein
MAKKPTREELERKVKELEIESVKPERTDKALIESERYFHSLLSNMHEDILVINRDYLIVDANKTFLDTCGRKREEVIGHHCYEISYNFNEPCEKRGEQCMLREVSETGEPRTCLHQHVQPDGSKVWVDIILSPLTDENGKVTHVIEAIREVSDLIKAQEELRESEEKFRTFMETASDLMHIADKDGNLTYINESMARTLGYSKEEMIGMRITQFISKESLETVFMRGREELKKRGEFTTEPIWVTKNGKKIYGELKVVAIYDSDGNFVGSRGVFRDLTQRKQSEEELVRLASFPEQSPDPVMEIDSEGRVIYLNSVAATQFPDLPETALQHPMLEGLLSVIAPLQSGEQAAVTREISVNNSVYQQRITYLPERNLIRLFAHDITDRVGAEEALKESERQLHFLSSQLLTAQENERKRIAQELHDGIGQTLSAIKFGMEDALDRMGKVAPSPGIKALEAMIPMVKNGIEEVRRICTDLRPSLLDDLGLLATISWFCREFQTIYSGIRIEKQINIKESEVPDILKTVIYRVLQEAFNNVAKHSKADLVCLYLRKTEGTIDLSIEDNGLGFDLEDAISAESSKRGLGLASMKERIEYSGGSFSIESIRGRGTIIRASWLCK